MEFPLVEHGSLMLLASQRSQLMPHMALVTRFEEDLPRADVEAEAARLASLPAGLGRRLRSPRIPGARPRWYADPTPPPVVYAEDELDSTAMAAWMDDQLSTPHDPSDGPGWQMSAARQSGGGTVVVISLNHLFGTGRDMISSCYLADPETSRLPESRPWVVDEAVDVAARLWKGARGVARLAGEVAALPWRRDPDGNIGTLRLPMEAYRDRDISRGRPSTRRVSAVATVDRKQWDACAEEAGGTTTTLQVAVVANLIRMARAARGGRTNRDVRLIVPVDLADRNEVPDASSTLGPVRLTSATVVLPGGRAVHRDLRPVRAATQWAFSEARDQVIRTGTVPVAPGVIPAMNLLPDDVTRRITFGVHGHFDGAASNVGEVPPELFSFAGFTPTNAILMAFPMGSDLSVAVIRHQKTVQIGVVADPSRLGSGATLRERLTNELDSWNLSADVW